MNKVRAIFSNTSFNQEDHSSKKANRLLLLKLMTSGTVKYVRGRKKFMKDKLDFLVGHL